MFFSLCNIEVAGTVVIWIVFFTTAIGFVRWANRIVESMKRDHADVWDQMQTNPPYVAPEARIKLLTSKILFGFDETANATIRRLGATARIYALLSILSFMFAIIGTGLVDYSCFGSPHATQQSD